MRLIYKMKEKESQTKLINKKLFVIRENVKK